MNTSTLELILSQIAETNTSPIPFRRKKDSQETEIGSLGLQTRKIWHFLEMLGDDILRHVVTFEQDVNLFIGQFNEQGDTIDEATLRDRDERIKKLQIEISKLISLYLPLNTFLRGMLWLDYGAKAAELGLPILGIRENYAVVCRKEDLRNDNEHPAIQRYEDILKRITPKNPTDERVRSIIIQVPVSA